MPKQAEISKKQKGKEMNFKTPKLKAHTDRYDVNVNISF